MKEIACDVLFEKGHTIAEKIFEGVTYPYEVLPKISEFILELGKTLPADKFECREVISGLRNLLVLHRLHTFMVRRLLMKRRKSVTVHLSEEMPLLEKAQLLEIQPS